MQPGGPHDVGRNTFHIGERRIATVSQEKAQAATGRKAPCSLDRDSDQGMPEKSWPQESWPSGIHPRRLPIGLAGVGLAGVGLAGLLQDLRQAFERFCLLGPANGREFGRKPIDRQLE
jgi:hypothetical protein